MGKQITDYSLYRWRYIIGSSVIALIVIALIIVVGLYIPGGLSHEETQSVVATDALNFSYKTFDINSIIDLPYHILQRFSFNLFGVSILSIKLPSIILSLLSACGLLLLLRMWFRKNVAVLTTIIVLTTGQFLFVAQDGTPSIVYIFGSIWLLLAALKVSRKAKWSGAWKMALFAIAALSLYTPLGLYILIALASAIMLHPHLRYLVKQLSKVKLLLALSVALILVAPLAYVVFRHPSIGLTLLGIPNSWPDLASNLFHLTRQYFDFFSLGSEPLMSPIYSIGIAILIILGIFRLATTKYTARSYIICAWIILILPLLIVNPGFTSITFVPGVLLIAMGVSTLITNWYTLFPRNPYARLAGLVPLAILIGGIVLTGLDRYMYGSLYDPQIANNFSKDLRLINKQLDGKTRESTVILASSDELPFYSVVARYHNNTAALTTPLAFPPQHTTTFIASHAWQQMNSLGVPENIITDGSSHDSNRFYIYKIEVK